MWGKWSTLVVTGGKNIVGQGEVERLRVREVEIREVEKVRDSEN